MSVHTEHAGKPEALHHGEAGAVSKAELLVHELPEDRPCCLAVFGRHRHDMDHGARAYVFPETNCHRVPQFYADERNSFIEDVITGNKGKGIPSQPSCHRTVVRIAVIGCSVPAAGMNEDAFHWRAGGYRARRR